MKNQVLLFLLLFAIGAGSIATAKAQVNMNDSLALMDLYNSTGGPNWRNNTNWMTAAPVSTWYGVTVVDNRVTQVVLYNNKLKGKLPFSIGNLDQLLKLDLGKNYLLRGSIPTSIGNLVHLTYLNFDQNRLSGTIPTSIGNLVQLTQLDLSSNQLSGAIPASIGKLVNLQELLLFYNQLSGAIPAAIGNLVNLQTLWLDSNRLSGSIPASIGNMVNLRFLQIPQNRLTGAIPASIGKLTNLLILNLNRNQLSGAIPDAIGNCVSLSQLYVRDNGLSSNIPSSLGNCTNLTNIDLAINQLSGHIPTSIANCTKLGDLDLSHNGLTGTIPDAIGKLNLNFLYLSFNQLSGGIPASFTNLHSVYILDLSHNHLSESFNAHFPHAGFYCCGDADVSYNNNTFNGLESLAHNYTLAKYAPQAPIAIHIHDNALAVYAGGMLSNNTYNWFRVEDGSSTTINGDSTYRPTQSGKYYVTVTNAIATQLMLYSDTVEFTTNGLTTSNRLAVNGTNSPIKQSLQVFPIPARDKVTIAYTTARQGVYTLQITDVTGKILLAKGGISIAGTNSIAVDISRFVPGMYVVSITDEKGKHTVKLLKE